MYLPSVVVGIIEGIYPKKALFPYIQKTKLIKLYLLHFWMKNVRANSILLLLDFVASLPFHSFVSFETMI